MTNIFKRRRGRPSLYTMQLAADICERIAQGKSLVSISRQPGMPRYPTIMQWLRENSDFAAMHRQAREDQADTLADQIIAIADEVAGATDNAKVQAARLRVDARKWTASKLKPKAYGERVEAALSGTIEHKTEPRSDFDIALAILTLFTRIERTGSAEQVATLKQSLPTGLTGLLSSR